MTKALKDKIIESLTSILPIALIVLVLSVAFVPLEAGTFVLFLVGNMIGRPIDRNAEPVNEC